MKVFISWSKPLSKKVAESLSDWLQLFPLIIEPWISGPDIDPGTRWNKELSEALEDTNFGIICITKEPLAKFIGIAGCSGSFGS
jgi:hypothetical protein